MENVGDVESPPLQTLPPPAVAVGYAIILGLFLWVKTLPGIFVFIAPTKYFL